MSVVRVTVKRIALISASKLGGALGALGGLCLAAVLLVRGLLPSSHVGGVEQGELSLLFLGGVGIVLLPFLYGLVAALLSLIAAISFNLAARVLGGLALDVDIDTAPSSGSLYG